MVCEPHRAGTEPTRHRVTDPGLGLVGREAESPNPLAVSDGFFSWSGTAWYFLQQLAVCVAPYLLVVGLTTAILFVVLRLWEADLEVPFSDRGDSLCGRAWMKSVQDHGWFLHNPDLGAPW